MAEQRVSMAQFEDFPLKQRRHFEHGGQPCSLGEGLVPAQEEKLAPVSLNRSRVAHDTQEIPSTTGILEPRQSGSQPMMTSYQAACAGIDESGRKKAGKKIIQPPGSSTSIGAAFFGGGPSMRSEPASTLYAGTTKVSPHLPGYTGHIPVKPTQASTAVAGAASNGEGSGGFEARPLNKDLYLLTQNYKPYGAGYTGRKALN